MLVCEQGEWSKDYMTRKSNLKYWILRKTYYSIGGILLPCMVFVYFQKVIIVLKVWNGPLTWHAWQAQGEEKSSNHSRVQ